MKKALTLSLVLALSTVVAYAQDAPTATPASTPSATVTVAPSEVKEVVATGTAAIGMGGLVAARRAATAQALRNAVERATGVFVSAHTLTQNYTLVHDQVTTRSEGFATLKEILGEADGTQSVTVKVRALVSLRPLAEKLKGLGLTRAWRVYVKPGKDVNPSYGPAAAALATLERSLTDAGFPVVSDPKSADLEISASPETKTTNKLPLDTAAGPMDFYSVRGQLALRATRSGTGEVVSALFASDTAATTDADTAGSRALNGAAGVVVPRLIDALLVLPARESQPVQLVVSRLGHMSQVGKLEDALSTIVGVRGVTRRSFDGTRAIWEMDVLTDALPQLSRRLEEDAALRSFHLTVSSDAGAKIVAIAKP